MTRMMVRLTMRVATLALCVMAVGAVSLRAQDTAPPPPQGEWHGRGGPGGPRGGERRLEHLTKALSLTPEQVTAAKAIDADTESQMKALHEDTATPREQKRDKMMAIHTASETKFKALLTDEQKTKYAEMEAKMRERMEHHRGDGPPPPPPPQ